MLKTMNKFFRFCCVFFFLITIQSLYAGPDVNTVSNDSIVSDEELDNWLDKYATELRDSVMLPSIDLKDRKNSNLLKTVNTPVNTPVPAKDEKKAVGATKGAMKGATKGVAKGAMNGTKYATFLSYEDSVELAESAKKRALCNPIFLDWVFGLPASTSLAFDNSDSVVVALRSECHRYVRVNNPDLYSYHRTQLPAFNDLSLGKLHDVKKDNLKLKVDGVTFKDDKIKIEDFKIQRWMRGARFQAHLSQTYITPNWYKGGESNMAANFYVKGFYNYSNKKNIQWDNLVEWKLGLNSAGSDSLRWLRVNDDLLRINTKLGVKAFKSFFYTAEYDLQTQLFNTYKPNTYIRTTGPFSPLKMNFSLGLDYKYKNMLSVFLSPISYKMVYVADTVARHGIDVSDNLAYQAGIKNGKRSLNQLGGLLRVSWAHNFNDAIGMEVKYYFFANYIGETKGVELDCEIIGNFRINRYLSAKVSLNPRYDTTIILSDGTRPKFQFKEFISLGFNYII